MKTKLEELINGKNSPKLIKLEGEINLKVERESSFTLGRNAVRGIINIERAGIIIDGSNAKINVEVSDCTTGDWALFYLQPSARNVRIRNLDVKVSINNPAGTSRTFTGYYNTAFGFKMQDCRLEIYADRQINLAGVYNNGNLDTHLETRADNMVITDSFIRLECRAEEFSKECSVYGIYNALANSIVVHNNFIYAVNTGDGARQKAVGIYTSGRFGRFADNNIKANATHNIGKELNHAHAYGFINDGVYSLITSNNIIGEWAGTAVALENKGWYAKVTSNKILATHTICGRCIRNTAAFCMFENNILTSTSRNARLLEHSFFNCIITGNIMEVTQPREECRSGCGIYAVGEYVKENIITGNIIRNVLNCGIFTENGVGVINDNLITSFERTVARADVSDISLLKALDERNIRSIE